jgi:predicted nucleic acid-binding protein
MPGSFFDTNVASGDPAKADRAEKLIGIGGMISVQVLNEITNVARRQMGMSWPVTRALLSMIPSLLPVQPLTVDIHETGLALAERCGLSPCDAIIAAIGRCTPIATRCGPKICRTGSCSMIACASSTRFVLHYIEI